MLSTKDYVDKINRVFKALDETNIKILSVMNQKGPRNLLEVARTLRIPAATVHSRIKRLEAEQVLETCTNFRTSKIGLERVSVTVKTSPGKFDLANRALKIPGYWRMITRSLGDVSDLYSAHAHPAGQTPQMTRFLDEMKQLDMISGFNLTSLGDRIILFHDFRDYDLEQGAWRFPWTEWLQEFLKPYSSGSADGSDMDLSPPRYEMLGDSLDLVILRELEKNARIKFSELSQPTGITLQAVKYRFGNLFKRRILHGFVVDIPRFPPELSERVEARLDVPPDRLEELYAKTKRLPFVHCASRVLGEPSLAIRARLPRSEVRNFLEMLSLLTRRRILSGFSYSLLDLSSMEWQPVPNTLYHHKTGWGYDAQAHLEQLRKLNQEWASEEPAWDSSPPTVNGYSELPE